MKEIYKALAAFQAEVPNIYKNSTGYGYKFSDLGEINDIIKPLLTKNGLGYVQPLDGENLKTIIFHVESGESIESSVLIPQHVQLAKMNEFQVLGSAITYLRRYSLSSMLGLITDEDADAAGEQVKPKATKEVRNRQEESKAGAEEMGTTKEEFMAGVRGSYDTPDQKPKSILDQAKLDIGEELKRQGYNRPDTMLGFINGVLGKDSIESIDEATLVAEALDNNSEEN